MSASTHREFLNQAANELEAARDHLLYSARKVKGLSDKAGKWSESQLADIEAFTSRYARVVDLLVHRVLRAIDQYELAAPGTLLDVANRAEARGLIESVDWLRELKDVRNRIAHDYAGKQLPQLLEFCLDNLPPIEDACVKTLQYIRDL